MKNIDELYILYGQARTNKTRFKRLTAIEAFEKAEHKAGKKSVFDLIK